MTIKLDPDNNVLVLVASNMDEALTIGQLLPELKANRVKHCIVHGPSSGVTLHLTLATHPKNETDKT